MEVQVAEETYRVMLEGAGLKLEREVDKAVGEQIAVLILTGGTAGGGGVPGAGAKGKPSSSGHSSAAGGLSLREFLNEHLPKRSPDKIAAIGVYLHDHDSKGTFSREDLEKAFESAGEPIPGNLSRDVKWTVKAGWIAPKSDSKGTYYVTNSGRDAVAKNFPKELLKKTRIEAGKKASKKAQGTS